MSDDRRPSAVPASPVRDRPSLRYDVALSFAGEDRAYVDDVASALRDASVSVFYDDYEQVTLWGKDLYAHLDWVYREASRHCVLFVSQHYAAKVWTNHERQSAQARAITESSEYVLPARFDDTEIPGLRSTVGYIDLTRVAPEELAVMILTKIGPPQFEPSFPSNIDHLFESLDIDEGDADERSRVWALAHAVYQAFERMSVDERNAVGGVLVFGCQGEFPEGVHISLDLLHRLTHRAPADLLDSLAAVRALNFKVRIRDLPHPPAEGELVPLDDRDIFMTFWSSVEPDSDDAIVIAKHVLCCMADHFCDEHGLEVVEALDFRGLSGKGVGFSASHYRGGQ